MIGVVGGAAALIAAAGNPVDWVNQRFDEFREGGTPSSRSPGSPSTPGSERYDYWRVAIDDAVDDPVAGSGGGGFQYSYNREGASEETPRDAHSVELELLSEQGCSRCCCSSSSSARRWPVLCDRAAWARRNRPLRRRDRGRRVLARPRVDRVVLDLPGRHRPGHGAARRGLRAGAAGPGPSRPTALAAHRARHGRRSSLALTMVPPYLSERYTNQAYKGWRTDPEGAYSALDGRVANPHAPLLAEGAIAREQGETERALEALREAIDRKPDEWAGHYYLALLLAREDPEAAQQELETALQLSPRSDEVAKALERNSRGPRASEQRRRAVGRALCTTPRSETASSPRWPSAPPPRSADAPRSRQRGFARSACG